MIADVAAQRRVESKFVRDRLAMVIAEPRSAVARRMFTAPIGLSIAANPHMKTLN